MPPRRLRATKVTDLSPDDDMKSVKLAGANVAHFVDGLGSLYKQNAHKGDATAMAKYMRNQFSFFGGFLFVTVCRVEVSLTEVIGFATHPQFSASCLQSYPPAETKQNLTTTTVNLITTTVNLITADYRT